MKFQPRPVAAIVGVLFTTVFIPAPARADDGVLPAGTNPANATNPRHGLFDWLDSRSAYSREFFPQPLLVDDTSLQKDLELEFSSLHTQADGQRSDVVATEIQKSFGMLTLDLSVPYENDSSAGSISQGIGNINLGARYPVYQLVSGGDFFDSTFGVGLEAGIPVSPAISVNAELNPKIFDDLKLGEHFSIQSVLGYSTLFGGGDNGGLQTFEYGFAFAYGIEHDEMSLPGVQQFTPLFELVGETGLNKEESGQNSLLGSMGFRADLKPVGDLQPSLGLGYVFPMDGVARTEVHWGIATSLTFEF